MELFDRAEELGALVTVKPDEIEIDIRGDHAYFCAEFESDRSSLAFFDITTRSNILQRRHPVFEELRASTLAAEAIKHLNRSRTVTGVAAEWLAPISYIRDKDSYTNWTNYVTRKEALIAEGCDEYEAQIRAALSTWTGNKVAAANGFSYVSRVREQYDDYDKSEIRQIKVEFVRP